MGHSVFLTNPFLAGAPQLLGQAAGCDQQDFQKLWYQGLSLYPHPIGTEPQAITTAKYNVMV